MRRNTAASFIDNSHHQQAVTVLAILSVIIHKGGTSLDGCPQKCTVKGVAFSDEICCSHLNRTIAIASDKVCCANRKHCCSADFLQKHGKCLKYTGTECAHAFGQDTDVFLPTAESIRLNDHVVRKFMAYLLKQPPAVTTTCLAHARRFLCALLMPPCQPLPSTAPPTPRPVCAQDCLRLKQDICPYVWRKMMSFPYAAFHLLVNTSEVANCKGVVMETEAGQQPECVSLQTASVDSMGESEHEQSCYHGNGARYTGNQRHTYSGLPCQPWSSQSPHKHPLSINADGNFCRNPQTLGKRPWCYTMNHTKRWEYCNIPPCGEAVCELDSQGLCSLLGINRHPIFVNPQRATQNELSSFLSCQANALDNVDMSKPCRTALVQFFCHLAFPWCDASTATPRPRPLCQHYCKAVRDKTCGTAVWKRINQATGICRPHVLLPDCEVLPKHYGGQAPECIDPSVDSQEQAQFSVDAHGKINGNNRYLGSIKAHLSMFIIDGNQSTISNTLNASSSNVPVWYYPPGEDVFVDCMLLVQEKAAFVHLLPRKKSSHVQSIIIVWRRRNMSLSSTKTRDRQERLVVRMNTQQNMANDLLVLKSFSQNTTGQYVCDAFVIWKNKTQQLLMSAAVNFKLFKGDATKFLTVPPPEVHAAVGQKLQLTCTAATGMHNTHRKYLHRSMYKMVWTRNGDKVGFPTAVVHQGRSVISSTLLIPSVKFADSGDYQCILPGGLTSHFTQLIVTDCYTGDGANYYGNIDRTLSGHTCQRWDERYPHNHTIEAELTDHGAYCRNPGHRWSRPWCYTTNLSVRWEPCQIPRCPVFQTLPPTDSVTNRPHSRNTDEVSWPVVGTTVALLIIVLTLVIAFHRYQRRQPPIMSLVDLESEQTSTGPSLPTVREAQEESNLQAESSHAPHDQGAALPPDSNHSHGDENETDCKGNHGNGDVQETSFAVPQELANGNCANRLD